MPAARDLAGQRFGKLVAVETIQLPDRAGRCWRCACDCGETCNVAQNRLTVPDGDPRAVRACDACRARRCVICGAPYLKPGSTKTCGADECRLENRRMVNRAITARTAAAAGIPPRTIGYRSRVARENPILYQAMLEAMRERARERSRNMTPEERAERNARKRELYAADPERWRAYMRGWIEGLSPERRAAWDAMQLESERRYKRKRATAKMMRDAAKLLKIMEDRQDDE